MQSLNNLISPQVSVNITSPAPTITGVPSNIIGFVGSASWGPYNSIGLVSGPGSYASQYGPVLTGTYDLGTAVSVAAQIGAGVMHIVRVKGSSDAQATATVVDTAGTPANALVVTAKYYGTAGNTVNIQFSAGTVSGAYNMTIWSTTLGISEIFKNISGSGNALWVAAAAAINSGQGLARGPSQLVTATAASSTGTPSLSVYTLSGGLNGTFTDSAIVGAAGASPTGMYVFSSTLINHLCCVGVTDTTTFADIVTFANAIPCVAHLQFTASQSVSQMLTAAAALGITQHRVLGGDYFLWNDLANQQTRYLPLAILDAAMGAFLEPQESVLNKALLPVIGTQRSATGKKYSGAELDQLTQANIDIVVAPGTLSRGQYFSFLNGNSFTSNIAQQFDNYQKLTNFITVSLKMWAVYFIGKLQSETVRLEAKARISGFLTNLWKEDVIGNVNTPTKPPFLIVLNDTNNSNTTVSQGDMIANIAVDYLSVIRNFIINYVGSQIIVTSSAQ